ncbi:hypothetical protein OG21DRAFT_522077 [Imleria badia]|nr:hypothetical protein OG21DRAFT_522077 [Imleria badia]
MSCACFGKKHSQVTTAEDEVLPSQAEIERDITKLKEDSAKDVERQLEQQRLAAEERKVEENVKKVEEDLEEGLAPAWKAAEHVEETIIKDIESDGKRPRRSREERLPRVTQMERVNVGKGGDGNGTEVGQTTAINVLVSNVQAFTATELHVTDCHPRNTLHFDASRRCSVQLRPVEIE